MDNFLDILLEAKNPKSKPPRRNRTIKVDPRDDEEKEDYTEEVDNEEIDNETAPEEEDSTDYTDEETDEEDGPTDYTDEELEVDPTEEDDDTDYTDGLDSEGEDGTNDEYNEEDETTAGEDTGDDEDTDYTDMEDNESGGISATGDSNSDDNSGNMDTTRDDTGDDGDNIGEYEKNKLILKDFINLYYLAKNTMKKLTTIDKTDIFINKIVTQVSSNFDVLQKQLFEFITNRFSKNKYVNNLYQYNYFIEAFKINVEMLKKISFFTTNS